MSREDIISRKTVLDYLKTEREKLITGMKKENDIIPIDARKGALLTIKAMACFITQLESNSIVNK